MKTIMEVKEAQFERLVLNEALPVVVGFYAPWSQHCEVMEPVLESAAEAAGNGAKFYLVNVSKNADLSGWYGVECIPTVLFFRNGRIADRILGTATKQEILVKLEDVREGKGEDGGWRVEDGKTGDGETSNTEHRTSNIEGVEEGEDGGWRVEDGKAGAEGTSNTEHRTSNIEAVEEGEDGSAPIAGTLNKEHGTEVGKQELRNGGRLSSLGLTEERRARVKAQQALWMSHAMLKLN